MDDLLSSEIFAEKVVVVIDDDPNSLDIATILLQIAGATVHQATNGKEGLQVIKTVQPRLVISDISMPIMDGFALINAIRSDAALKSLTVIALTAHAMTGDRERILAAGFDSYLSKPLHPSTFTESLLRVLTYLASQQSLAIVGE